MVPVIKKTYVMQPAPYGSKIHGHMGRDRAANIPEAVAIRMCDGSHTKREIEKTLSGLYPDFTMDWKKFDVALDWRENVTDPNTAAPQLASFDRQLALEDAAPDPWPWFRYRLPYIASATLFLTHMCNHRCTYCFEGEEHWKEDRLPGELWLDTLDQLLELGLQHLTVSGGEPKLHPVFWELIERALKSGVYVNLQTNGSLWTPEDIDRLAELGLGYVNLSLPSVNEEVFDKVTRSSGDLPRTLENLKRFKEKGFHVRVKTVLTPENVEPGDVERVVRTCHSLGAEEDHLQPFVLTAPGRQRHIPPKEALDTITELADALRSELTGFIIPCPGDLTYRWEGPENIRKCGGVKSNLTFLPDGSITFCASMALTTGRFVFGNIKTDRIRDLWYSDRVDSPNHPGEYKEPCRSCEYLEDCQSGCMFYSLMDSGELWGQDPRCFKCASELYRPGQGSPSL